MHLEDFLSTFDARLEVALDEAAATAVEFAQESAPDVNGPLRKSIRVTRWSRNERVIEATAPYAGFVENGRPGVEARPGGALHFFIGGVEIFAKRVGPAAPNPFMARARNDVDRAVSAVIKDELLGGSGVSIRRGADGRFSGRTA